METQPMIPDSEQEAVISRIVTEPTRAACEAKGCDRLAYSKSLCLKHYKRMRKYGDPNKRERRPAGLTAGEALEYHGWTVTESGCWEWGRRNKAGYGLVWSPGRGDMLAHRVAFVMWRGPIPVGKHVCHTCDNPPCMNPSHLWLGTDADNNADKEAKGRGNQPKGARNSQSVLTAAQVQEIRSLRAAGAGLRELAKEFGVSETTISNIYRRKTWKHV